MTCILYLQYTAVLWSEVDIKWLWFIVPVYPPLIRWVNMFERPHVCRNGSNISGKNGRKSRGSDLKNNLRRI